MLNAIVKKSLNEIEVQVKELFAKHSIVLGSSYKGTGKMNETCSIESDKFRISLSNSDTGESYSFDFYQGVGHRVKKRSISGRMEDDYVIHPCEASVMYCLLLDMQCGEMSFYDFCDEFGYNHDSRSHLALYDKVEKQNRELKRVFKGKGEFMESVRLAVEEY